jgi:hypothetical protein
MDETIFLSVVLVTLIENEPTSFFVINMGQYSVLKRSPPVRGNPYDAASISAQVAIPVSNKPAKTPK